MISERECFVYIVPPGATEFVTAGRFRWIDDGAAAVGQFVYGRSYRERADAVEFGSIGAVDITRNCVHLRNSVSR